MIYGGLIVLISQIINLIVLRNILIIQNKHIASIIKLLSAIDNHKSSKFYI